jgi:UDP-3-O-[3-hydroxymyristoyl] glucosamine N-acyltransferase
MEFTAKVIAEYLKGEIVGEPETRVSDIARIEEGHEGALSFLANPKYEHFIYTTGSSIVLVNRNFVPTAPVKATLIKVDDSYQAFASLLQLVERSKPKKKGIHPTAVIEASASIGTDVYIGAFAYIGENCVIGNDCHIYPHVYIGDSTKIGNNCLIYAGVKVYHECRIGNGCILHAGSVIGADGFGFAPQSESEFKKIPQIGNVILEDNVEIGAIVAIDRATMGSTIIRKGVKLDNLIQIGHNVEIGENTVIAGQTGIAGSTKIGKNCMIGGQVGIIGHIKIPEGTKIGAKSGVLSAIKKENLVFTGYPAVEHNDFLRSTVVFRRLPDLQVKIDNLEKEIELLKKFHGEPPVQ